MVDKELVRVVIIDTIGEPTRAGNIYTREALEKIVNGGKNIPITTFREMTGNTTEEKIKSVSVFTPSDIRGCVHTLSIEDNSLVGYINADIPELESVTFGIRAFVTTAPREDAVVFNDINLISIDVLGKDHWL